MSKQEKIKVSAGEDLLAFIPHIVGYWPENSVVCIGMAGKALRATMRLDLPRAGTVNLDGFAAIAAGQLAGDAQADGSLVAIFGGADWTDPEDLAEREVFDALRGALAAAGLPVRDAWYVGPDHWRSIECLNPACCPWPGHSNRKITGSLVSAELVYRGSSVEQSPRERVPALAAVQDPGHAAKVAAAAEPLRDALGRDGAAENQLVVTLGAWETALARWPERPDTGMCGYLTASLSNTAVRDAVMVSLATTPEASLAGVLGVGYLEADVPGPAVPRNWYGGSQAAGRDVSILDESDGGIVAAGELFADILLGGSAGGGRPVRGPDWARMDQAEELLLFLASNVDGEGKAPLLCVLGWIQWCRGKGTWAGAYFEESLKYVPGYKLAHLLDRLLQMGFVAAWAKDRQTAWPGYRKGVPEAA
ncbi:DUF4192 family protein [Arthrobacter sp. STN4]|uniref:DUF4192 family protein n=1 Tax=Arthrobacter sp. STN4 TaxID=2923276 RepID=UPI00211A80E5|nr:DUF4192 family protein [Arthrobacter sp. STN4]MCQ9164102.1 DUF4192 domain-containing protein [Arthrobacter sp. STN4]